MKEIEEKKDLNQTELANSVEAHKIQNEVQSIDSCSPNSTNGTPFTGVEMSNLKKPIENYKPLIANNKEEEAKNKDLRHEKSGIKSKKLFFFFSNVKEKKKNHTAYNIPKTPFGLNRYILVFGYAIYTFICGCPYWGWNGIQEMLYKSGAFEPLCNDSPNITYLEVGNSSYIDCPARQQRINNLYTIAFASHFVSSAFMGAILDRIGPKLTSFVGLSSALLSWSLLAFADKLSTITYYFSAAFMGISADPCYLPLLSVSNMFPGNESLIMSVLGSVRSCSFAIPVILALIFTNSNVYRPSDFWMFCIGYVGIGLGIAIFISVFLIPMRAIKIVEDNEEIIEAVRRRSLCSDKRKSAIPITALDSDEIELNVKGKSMLYEEKRANFTKYSNSNLIENKNLIQDEEISTSERKSFLHTIKQAEFFLILPFFCLTLIRVEFFTKSNKNQLQVGESNVYKMFAIMNILSFLPGPIFGSLCDYIGVLPVLFILNLLGMFVYLFLIINNLICKGISIFFFFLFCSFCLSNLYCYVGATFPPEHFGKLCGLASMVAGLFALTSYLWYYISAELLLSLSPYNFGVVDGIMIGFGLINLVIWIFMHKIKQSKVRKKKTEGSLVAKV